MNCMRDNLRMVNGVDKDNYLQRIWFMEVNFLWEYLKGVEN